MSNGPTLHHLISRIDSLLKKQASGTLSEIEFNILKHEIESLYNIAILDVEINHTVENKNEDIEDEVVSLDAIEEKEDETKHPIAADLNLNEIDTEKPPVVKDEEQVSALPPVLEEKVVEEIFVPEPEESEAKVEETAPDNTGHKSVLNDQHSKEKSTLADRINLKKGSLKEAIGVNRRFYFIKELFDNNASEFDKAVRFIDNLTSLEDSKIYVDKELAVKFKWKADSEAKAKFEKLLDTRFTV